jgi:outer membrane protein assembly factor BamB
LLVLLLLAAISRGAWSGDATLHPPFRQVWEFAGGRYQLQDAVVAHGAVYLATTTAYLSLDLESGRRKWEVASPNSFGGMYVVSDDQSLFVQVNKKHLRACDPDTGGTKWSLPIAAYGGPPAIAGDTIYCVLTPTGISAVDTHSGQVRWSRI